MKNVKSWPWSPCQDSSVPIPAKQSTEEPSIKIRKAKDKHCNVKMQKHYNVGYQINLKSNLILKDIFLMYK